MALSTISGTTGITDATITSAKLADFSAAVDLNGVELLLDADQDTSITADTDDVIDFKIAGVEHISLSNSSGDTIIKPRVDAKDIIFQQFDGNKIFCIDDGNFVSVGGNATAPGEIRIYEDTDNGSHYSGFKVGNLTASVAYALPNADGSDGQVLTTDGSGVLTWATASANTPSSADAEALGSASLEWADLFLADASTIQFGADQDVTLTHVHNTGLLLNTASVVQFRDSAINIGSPADGDLDINADDEIELNSTLIDINGNVEISGTAVTTGVHTFTAVPVFPNNTIETADIQADAIDGTKIADDAINSEHYTDGSIDTAHIADSQITTAKIADANITTAKLNTALLTGATDIGAGIADADLILLDDGAGGTLRKSAASRIKTYIADVTLTTAAQTNITSLGTLTALTVDDVAVDGKVITMTGSSGDTFVTTVAANGATSLVTTDASAAAANIVITADGTFEADGTTITLDSAGDIVLDADGADIVFKDGGTSILTMTNDSTDFVMTVATQDKDFVIKGDDGGSAITPFKLDMSAGGDLFLTGGLIDLKNDGSAVSQIKFYCESSNAHAQTLIGAPHSQSATNTLTLPDGNNGVLLSTVSTATVTNKTLTSPVINTGTFGTSILPVSANGTTLGSASKEFADLFLSDGGQILFGADQDVTLTHVADVGVALKSIATADDKPVKLTLQTGETDMAANDVIGAVDFQAPDEGTGTDAILVAAGIEAVAEGDFSSSSNATSLVFKTGASEAAAGKIKVTSAGHLFPMADDSYDLGGASNQWRNIYTGDLHLSNMSKTEGNVVDGTKGDWTIQEGSDELYLMNNNSGKKYKFNLTEV